MYLFEVNTETGISIPEMSLPQNIYDEGVKPPSELLPPKLNNSELDDRQTLPNSIYKLNLAVYYDDDFFNQFPAATPKYVIMIKKINIVCTLNYVHTYRSMKYQKF